MFLIIKVNVPIDFRLFQGTLKHLQARRIKRNYKGGVGGGGWGRGGGGEEGGGYQLMKNVGHYGSLTKKSCQLKLSKMARNAFNILRGK